ncbi:RHS repeat-associated core domain-containing protein [Clostridium sp. VAP51]|uniref:RHS repeat-associated core domain-containing protein n=1 Tax=Clostridium sp. VAP51 TaxID=2949978 RepID=UPI002079AF9C|nr:RHS repeat-associated core domain-containing protein [Clostridium sp. VAP51]
MSNQIINLDSHLSSSTNYSLPRYYYSVDEQGSTDFITDSRGTIKNEYWYDAFGNVLDSKEEVHNRITYTGQQFDGITQQYYLRARYYNPVIGRFTQEDVYRGDGLNLYAYCGNNPVAYYDPSGYVTKTYYPDLFDLSKIDDSSSSKLIYNILRQMGISDKSILSDLKTGSHQG